MCFSPRCGACLPAKAGSAPLPSPPNPPPPNHLTKNQNNPNIFIANSKKNKVIYRRSNPLEPIAPNPPVMELPTTFTLGLILLLQTGCGLFENEQDPRFFTATPVSAVEVALEIRAEVGQTITIQRDGAEIFSFRMGSADTVVLDSGLEPATSYIWEAQSGSINMERQATTLDTTSHAFTWQKYEFGEDTYSFIYDAAVIDENNIWAVGEIYLNDSLGVPETTPYNAAHWDGQEWEILKLYYNGYPPPIRTVLAFSETNVWLDPWFNWDGSDFKQLPITDALKGFEPRAMWGKSATEFFAVGNGGNIVINNGEDWQKLESGTQLNINDIWGSQHPTTGEWEILAVASAAFVSNSVQVLKLDHQKVTPLSTNGLGPGIDAVWFEQGKRCYISGNDVYQSFKKDDDWAINEQFQPPMF